MIKKSDSYEPAEVIVKKAKEQGFIQGPLSVVPELADGEKLLISFLAKSIKEYTSGREKEELDMQEIYNLFVFVYAKGGESACNWQKGEEFSISPQGIFKSEVPFNVPREMIEYYSSEKVPEELFEAFQGWHKDYPDYCAENNIHPVIPLLEALKWVYRISTGMGLDYLECGD